MPSYNNGQYIGQALDSILMQQVNFIYQIIITDDCSQDNSPQIIREYARKHPDKIVALYSNKNCRLFQNVIKALQIMDSEYFCVLDPDDYWTDEKRLQKAVDFLDDNPEYTIYATNTYTIYEDKFVKLKYDRPNINEYTSTYEDYLIGKEILSTTIASTYRNVYFMNGIPKEYLNLVGTKYEEIFRADTARNLIHLRKGKAFFVNECVGYYRYHGNGLSSSLLEYERYITSAFARIGYYEFFGRQNEEDYARMIQNLYIRAVNRYHHELISGNMQKLSTLYQEYFKEVMEWLSIHNLKEKEIRVPFSLELFQNMSDKKIIIWGTGYEASRLIETYHIPIQEDTFFVDNDNKKQGTKFMGKQIKNPKALYKEKDALVIPASGYYKEIIRMIKEQKLCAESQILNIFDFEKNWME